MSSSKAQEKHYGKMEKYRSSEGRVVKIPYKGDLKDTVDDYLGDDEEMALEAIEVKENKPVVEI